MARKKGATKEKGRSLIWLQGLACGAAAAVAPRQSAMIAVLLAPAVVALILDRLPGRPVGRAVLLCGAAACVGPVMVVWQLGNAAGFALLADPGFFGSTWVACAGGWLLTQILPFGIRGILEALSLSRAARLRAERERLIRAWGPMVSER